MSHVLFISHARGIHGAEAVMVQAVKASVAKNTQVTVVVPSIVPDEGLHDALSSISGVDILALPYRAAGGSWLRTMATLIYNFRAARYLAGFVKRQNITAIYSSSSITSVGFMLAQMTHLPHIWHWHESVDKRFGWHHSLAGFYRVHGSKASHIVFISHKQQTEWEQALQTGFSNAVIVYNPIKRIAPSQATPHDGIRVGFIGHFEERKNLPMLCRAFEQLHQQYPNTSLWLCGSMGEQDQTYINRITTLKEPVLHVLPQTSDVASFYNRIDILVLPSWRETMPLVILEAMQAGVCVLQTNQSGMSELLEDGKQTLFFSPDQPEHLLQLLQRCMDGTYRQQIAQAGQEKALQLAQAQTFDQQITDLICA